MGKKNRNREAAAPEDETTEGSTSEAVSASNVAASEAAGDVTRARAEASPESEPKNPDRTRPADSASEDQTPEDAPKKGKRKFDLVDRFLELSDYERSDVHGFSEERRTVVTTNGGKYEVSPKGTRLRKLAGPDTPAMVAEAAEEGEEE